MSELAHSNKLEQLVTTYRFLIMEVVCPRGKGELGFRAEHVPVGNTCWGFFTEGPTVSSGWTLYHCPWDWDAGRWRVACVEHSC